MQEYDVKFPALITLRVRANSKADAEHAVRAEFDSLLPYDCTQGLSLTFARTVSVQDVKILGVEFDQSELVEVI